MFENQLQTATGGFYSRQSSRDLRLIRTACPDRWSGPMGWGVAEMENIVITGAHCFPLSGSVAGPIWSEQGGSKLAMPAVAGSLRVAVLSGRPVYRARFCALINPISIELPTTGLMRMSVPEP